MARPTGEARRFVELLEQADVGRYGGDYLKTWECSAEEIRGLAYAARALEELHRANVSVRAFDTGLAVSNFRDKSTRTRNAFSSAASMLGLQVEHFDEQASQVGHGETTRETAAMLSFAAEVLGIRDDLYVGESSAYMENVARAVEDAHAEGVLAQRPCVVNLQCDQDHPTQSMSDLLALAEHFGEGGADPLGSLRGKTVAVTWAYSPSYGKPLSVPQGLIALLPRFGVNVRLAHPPGYDLMPEVLARARAYAAASGAHFSTHGTMADAFRGAHVVYPKSWAPLRVLQQRTELVRNPRLSGVDRTTALAALEKDCLSANKSHAATWECDEPTIALAEPGCLYMHCLPADISGVSCERGEVAASVFERYRIATYRQASHKPFVVAAAILLCRFRDPAALLRRMVHDAPRRRNEEAARAGAGGEGSSPGAGRAVAVPPMRPVTQRPCDEVSRFAGVAWPSGLPLTELDSAISALAKKYEGLACEILREAIRIPEDHVAQDPRCGMSNHEEPRLRYLRDTIVRVGAVEDQADVFFDEFGSLVWIAQDRSDGVPLSEKIIVYFDGHTDTVAPLPEEWDRKTGGGIDVYRGLVDADKVDVAFLESEVGYVPPKSEWEHLIFGRGGADQLSGVVSQIIATKIMIELKHLGALAGVAVRSYGTIAEEDNDGGAPMYVLSHLLPKEPEWIPDAVVHTEGTGDVATSACGIYTGQRGRMQIEVEVVGRSSHGSMTWMGVNPLEYGAAIITEARVRFDAGKDDGAGFDPFLGQGTRTASWAECRTPSDCAVPASFTFRFDRRLTAGEAPADSLAAVERLPSVARARAAGCAVHVRVPRYTTPTWRGTKPDNEQIYPGWMTPPDHAAVRAGYEAWKRVVTHGLLKDVPESYDTDPEAYTRVSREPRVSRWIFSTDGVGYVVPQSGDAAPFAVPPEKGWIPAAGNTHHPAQVGMGIGYEQNTHKIGEFVDGRHFPAACAWVARFPSLFAVTKKKTLPE